MKATATRHWREFLVCGDFMIEEIKKASQILGMNAEDLNGIVDSQGKPYPAVKIMVGDIAVLVVELGSHFEVAVQFDIPDADSKLLEEQHPDTKNRLLTILKREMQEGRTGYAINTDQKGIHAIKLVQKVLVSASDPTSIQRFQDAIQEVVVVACRCGAVLGQAFGDIKTNAETYNRTYDPIMYR